MATSGSFHSPSDGSDPMPGKGNGGAPAEEGAPAWVLTFGDMMSLLLTFFILLFSMSELEVVKFQLAAKSLSEALGGISSETVEAEIVGVTEDTTTEVVLSETMIAELVASNALDRIAELLQEFVDSNQLQDNLIVDRQDNGVYLRIQDVALFRPGVGEIQPESEWIVSGLALVTSYIKVPLVVSGHTDTIPLSNSRFRSNWELSAVRAAGIARALVGMGQDPLAIRVEAFGEFVPVATNDTPEGRAQNRRVELFYSRQDVLDSGWSGDDDTISEDLEMLGAPTQQTESADQSEETH